jgi:hypothetical protein
MPARPVDTHSPMSRGMEPFELPGAPGEEEPAETARAARPLRIGFATLWVLLAVAGAIMRACSEQG